MSTYNSPAFKTPIPEWFFCGSIPQQEQMYSLVPCFIQGQFRSVNSKMMLKDQMLHSLLNKFSKSSLEHFAFEQSKGRTYDIEDLNNDEVTAMFQLLIPGQKPKSTREKLHDSYAEMELKRLRSIVLADAEYIKLYTPGDWTRFNRFMKEVSVYKQSLNEYKKEEFPVLIRQFKSMRQKYDQNKLKTGSQAWYQFLGFKPSIN